uniref:PRAME family member 12-like n=1 Tax=Myodes glareolus TaxID=447135 RepID=UPI002021405D|nr:PRAME family member 12-like [Myodes glareolus]
MSLKAPHTILEMAVKSLLKNKDFDISVLQQVPMELFPSLFKEAFNSRCMKILTALVASWPFACLPMGTMMKVPDVVILQVELAAIEMLLTQMFHLRRSKLQVLDLRDESNRFWDVWHGLEDELHERQAYLLQWAQQQKRSVKLYCMKMTICETPVELIMAILKVFPPESVEELELSRNWSLATLSSFAPPLDQMRNLHKLHLKRIFMYVDIGTNPLSDREEKCESRFLSKIFKLSCLKHLSMNDVFFSGELLKHLCRGRATAGAKTRDHSWCQKPRHGTEHLADTCEGPKRIQNSTHKADDVGCCVLENGKRLQLLELWQLWKPASPPKHGSVFFRTSNPVPLHLEALLPLHPEGLDDRLAPDFLHCKANLSTLTEEFYPAPLECYDQVGHILEDKFTNLCPDLLNILRSKRHPKKGLFLTKFCHKCVRFCVYDLGTCHKKDVISAGKRWTGSSGLSHTFLLADAIDGMVHMVRGGQEGLDLGPGTEMCHIGIEQGEVVQAARGQDLVDQQQI